MPPDVFAALANPVRRELLALLRAGPQPVNALAARFDRGRPAISEHLSVLRAVGLVSEHRRGREHHYRLEAAPLRSVAEWLQDYETFWITRLDGLATLLDEESP